MHINIYFLWLSAQISSGRKHFWNVFFKIFYACISPTDASSLLRDWLLLTYQKRFKNIWQYLIQHTEKAMATHSNTLAWKIPWTQEPGGLQSMGSLGVGHDWATSLSLFTFMHWRRKWQPTPVFLSWESQGRGSLVGCRLWGRTESDTTAAT